MPDKYPTKWKLEPHTAAKHAILRKYLGAWFPKLAWRGRLVFVDGFAGAGEYLDGEPGSPVIALNALLEHRARFDDCEVIFLFIEERRDRYDNLREKVDAIPVPSNVKLGVLHGTFADEVGNVLDKVEGGGHYLAPAFVMVDPFGPKGLPMDLMHRITRHPRSELHISLMYEPITRWRNQPAFENSLDSLYGCGDWRRADEFDPDGRREFLHDLYVQQLKAGGMEFVRSFEMRDQGNRTEYFLVYATKHLDGLKAMKRAMWAADPLGRFQFSDATDKSQLTLFTTNPDIGQLKSLILTRFGGQKGVRVEDVERFVLVETSFHDGHYNRAVLNPMEKAGELYVAESPRKRKGSFPAGTVLDFA
jgi:three-Cys-motif partner protein